MNTLKQLFLKKHRQENKEFKCVFKIKIRISLPDEFFFRFFVRICEKTTSSQQP
jgi:hypothetical protein